MADHIFAGNSQAPVSDVSSLPFFAQTGAQWRPQEETRETNAIAANAPLQGTKDHTSAPDDAAVPLPPPRPHDAPRHPSQQALADKTLRAIAAGDPATMAQPSRDAQTVVKQFLDAKSKVADKDKAAVLKDFAPAFDKAITEADTNFARIEKQSEPNMKAAREGYIVANSNYTQSVKSSIETAKNLPEPARTKAELLLAQVAVNGAEMPSDKDLARAFKDQPGFLTELRTISTQQQAVFAAAKNLDAANKPVLDAALEQDRTRLAYERSAQSVGNWSLAKSIDAERKLVDELTIGLTEVPDEVRPVYSI
jgi:hypothetical protein